MESIANLWYCIAMLETKEYLRLLRFEDMAAELTRLLLTLIECIGGLNQPLMVRLAFEQYAKMPTPGVTLVLTGALALTYRDIGPGPLYTTIYVKICTLRTYRTLTQMAVRSAAMQGNLS